jgi:hypothetical protein
MSVLYPFPQLFRLKAILCQRKFTDSSGVRFSLELWFIISLLISIPIAALTYVVVTWANEAYLFEILGLLYSIFLLGWVLAPLSGSRISDFLDLGSLFCFPVSKTKLFFSSVSTSLIDASVLPIYPMIWGISLGLGMSSSFWLIPLYLGLNFLFLIQCLACSQIVIFAYQTIFRKARWFSFFATFLLPLGLFFLILFSYSKFLVSLPLFDTFSRPDLAFLESTKILPSSLLVLVLRGVYHGNFSAGFFHFGLFCLEFLVLLGLGSWIIHRVVGRQGGAGAYTVGRGWLYQALSGFLRQSLRLKLELVLLVIKDLKLMVREPHTKVVVLLPLLSAFFFWGISYVFMSVIQELRQGAFPALLGGSFLSFMEGFPIGASEVLYAWPMFFYFALFIIASDFSSNILGVERQGINHFFLLPLTPVELLFSKNLSILIFLGFPSLVVTFVAAVMGAHSVHTLQALWLVFILCIFLVFMGGNLLSVIFPMRIESALSAALHKDSFSRTVLLGLSRLFLSAISGVLVFPIFLVCVYPLVSEVGYMVPFSHQSSHSLSSLLYGVLDALPSHLDYLIYALGAYVLGLHLSAKQLHSRREKILTELNRSES